MKALQNWAGGIFILCVAVLSVVSVMGIWEVFGTDVIWKSFQTLGLLAVVSVVVIAAGKFVSPEPTLPGQDLLPQSHPLFKGVRNVTLGVLIVSAALLALLGVLAIWEVIQDSATVYKSLSSLAVLAFSSLIIVMVCLERERNELWQKRGHELGGIAALAFVLLIWLLLATLN
jgi:Na+/proline symporter